MRALKPEQGDQLVIFSDLDGSLLDHDSYSFKPALPALAQLAEQDIPLVLVTSKTRGEVLLLRDQLKNDHPFIVENGAATLIPRGYFESAVSQTDQYDIVMTATQDRQCILDVITEIRKTEAFRFRGFSELGVDGIAAITGLGREQAAAANDRIASEPVAWDDRDDRLISFAHRLADFDLECTRGGRFMLIAGKFDKANAMRGLMQRYKKQWPQAALKCVAIGDAPNDLGMLNAADLAVVIKSNHGLSMPIVHEDIVVRTTKTGPEGWNEAVLSIIR